MSIGWSTAFAGVRNNDPDAVDDFAFTKENTSVTISVLANDSDPDNDTITINSVDNNSIQGGTVVNNGDGTVTYTPPNNFKFPPNDTFDYTISDGKGGTDTATVTIQVGGCTCDLLKIFASKGFKGSSGKMEIKESIVQTSAGSDRRVTIKVVNNWNTLIHCVGNDGDCQGEFELKSSSSSWNVKVTAKSPGVAAVKTKESFKITPGGAMEITCNGECKEDSGSPLTGATFTLENKKVLKANKLKDMGIFTKQFKTVYELELDKAGTSTEKLLGVNGTITLEIEPKTGCMDAQGWKMVLVVNKNGLDKKQSDYDGDGLTNGQEKKLKTGIFNPDSDGDGAFDGVDAKPLDPNVQ